MSAKPFPRAGTVIKNMVFLSIGIMESKIRQEGGQFHPPRNPILPPGMEGAPGLGRT